MANNGKISLETVERVRFLRRRGYSLPEISNEVGVSKTSVLRFIKDVQILPEYLSEWVGKRGGSKKIKLLKLKKALNKGESIVRRLTDKEQLLILCALYWAEGNKQKEHNPSTEVVFSNSDPSMIKLYLKWLEKCLGVQQDRLVFEIYIHRSHHKTIKDLTGFWSEVTGFPVSKFDRVYFKKNKIHSFRKNRGPNYSGVLRIWVRRSTDLNRKIQGWTQGICFQSGAASQNRL